MLCEGLLELFSEGDSAHSNTSSPALQIAAATPMSGAAGVDIIKCGYQP
jgi:hypothetical protein